jgi:hypothetical protein
MTVSAAAKPVPVEDFLAVQELVARYCWYIDENRGADWASLYTDDGIFEGTRPAPVIGREALEKVPGELNGYFNGNLRHQAGNLYVEYGADPGTLIARFYNQVLQWDKGLKPVMLALSTATLVRDEQAGRWRIQRNTIRKLS